MKGVLKTNLPQKTCIGCGLHFTWRKKWEHDWNNVKYCSKKCKRKKELL